MRRTKQIDTTLVVCRPFLPDKRTDALGCNFYFMSLQLVDIVSLKETAKAYKYIYVEHCIAEKMPDLEMELGETVKILDDFVVESKIENKDVKIAFHAGNDTHVNFMTKIAKRIPNHIFLIPEKARKDEGAASALEREGEKYIELIYGKTESPELIKFMPQYILTGADFTSDYNLLTTAIKDYPIRTVALQEGPEDWHYRVRGIIKGEIVLKAINHYRNADIQFLQGSRVLSFIRPKYFTVTGNPKVDLIQEKELPTVPKVFINCNFTYVDEKPSYESHGVEWVESVIRVCKDLGLDYIISQHPRDLSEWNDEHLVKSNAYKVSQQIEDSSICISRFSNIPYEAYSRSRNVIYYNLHLEPMPIFVEDHETQIPVLDTEEELYQALKEHRDSYPYVIDKEAQRLFLHRHAGNPDGKALERIIQNLKEIGIGFLENIEYLSGEIGEYVDICEHKVDKTVVLYTRLSKKTVEWHDVLFMIVVEALAMLGMKVYVVSNAYAKCYHYFSKLECHKDIQFELAKDYKFEFEQITFDKAIWVDEFSKEKCESAVKEFPEADSVQVEALPLEVIETIMRERGMDNLQKITDNISESAFWEEILDIVRKRI